MVTQTSADETFLSQDVTIKTNMSSPKKKAAAKVSVKFKDLKSKGNPKGGGTFSGSGGGETPMESLDKRKPT
jgi:hypothetical protein